MQPHLDTMTFPVDASSVAFQMSPCIAQSQCSGTGACDLRPVEHPGTLILHLEVFRTVLLRHMC